jgi:predicted ATP-grasp superfamily ATP-dependent carboligase
VAVFDLELPTGVAFARSLARAGIPIVAGSTHKRPAGGFSRYVRGVVHCPPIERADEFVDWLEDQHRRGSFELVAPTSDFVSFACAEVTDRRPGFLGVGTSPERVRTCLFKDRFAAAMTEIGFPVPDWAAPSTAAEALADAERLGFPVLLKPRSHAGIGTARGRVATTPEALGELFRPYPVDSDRSLAVARDPSLALPMLQRYHVPGTVDVVSLSGCLDPDGQVLALSHCRKLGQWPRRLGVGTMFEPAPPAAFTSEALTAVRSVLGSGLFELEVLVERTTGGHWAIDLNPRAFGQISLDIALGNDLPVVWYDSVTGRDSARSPARRRAPRYWHHALPTHIETAVRVATGPDRLARSRLALTRAVQPHVGAMFDVRDPLPGMVFGLRILRHPRRLVRTMTRDIEAPPAGSAVKDEAAS